MSTIKMKTHELIGPALSWAVEEAQGQGTTYLKFWNMGGDKRFVHCEVMRNYSVNWFEGGPIIEREKIDIRARVPDDVLYPNPRFAWKAEYVTTNPYFCATGPTPLIAAMRCFVASKLGDEVTVPQELLATNA